MADYKKYINALRKCANEHENDITPTWHIIVSDLCRDTANLLEVLEQEPILDKIRAEIEQLTITEGGDDYVRKMAELFSLKMKVLQIIDKYRAESEDKE